jgi:hypothetical protein
MTSKREQRNAKSRLVWEKKYLGRPWRRFEEVTIMDHAEIGGYRLKTPVPEQGPVGGLL